MLKPPPGGPAPARTLTDAVAGRWLRGDGELLVGWEAANPALADELFEREGTARTPHFMVATADGAKVILHRLALGAVDNDLGDLLGAELFASGILPTTEGWFQRVFSGVVSSMSADPDDGWFEFYANTLQRQAGPANRAGPPSVLEGAVATFAAIYDHAAALVRGDSVLDTGSCFGFFPLLLAAGNDNLSVKGSDCSAGTVALARRMAARLGSRTTFLEADVTRPLGRGPIADTVTALHLLEHLPADQTASVLTNLCDAARRRVIAAVPIETGPDPLYGHVRTFDLTGMADLGEKTGWLTAVHEYQGGWLVLDRP